MRRSETPEERRKRIARKNNQAAYASRKKKFVENMRAFIKTEGLWDAFQEWRAR